MVIRKDYLRKIRLFIGLAVSFLGICPVASAADGDPAFSPGWFSLAAGI